MGNMGRKIPLLLVLLLCFSIGECQWLSSWIEVEPTLPTAMLRGGNVSLCDGGNATLQITVRGGAGPWRVEVLRDDKMFSLVTLEARPMQLFPAIFAKQDSDASARTNIEVSLSGSYRLNRVCDLHFCNGTVANTSFTVSFDTAPTAQLVPLHTHMCSNGERFFSPYDAASPRVHLAGTPPFTVLFSLVGDSATTVSMRYNKEGLHDLPELPSRGLWAMTNLSDSRACPSDTLSLPLQGTVAVSRSPEALLFLRSGEVCGNQAAELEVRQTYGSLPWRVTLTTPAGEIEIKNITRRSHIFKADRAGNYSISAVSDDKCEGRAGGGGSGGGGGAVQVRHLPLVSGVLHAASESTCQGIFRNITGEVKGTPPFSLEVWRSGAFFRRMLHDKEGSFTFAVDMPGSYTLRAVTDGRYCSVPGEGTVSLAQLALPSVAPMNGTRCEGAAVTLAVRGTPPFKVSYTVTGHTAEQTHTASECAPVDVAKGEKWCSVTLFEEGRARAGVYTVTGVADAQCSVAVLASVRVLVKPVMTLHTIVGHVCDGGVARLELRLVGGVPGVQWSAVVRYPGGEVRTITSDKQSAAWDVKAEGEYVLESAASGGCGVDVATGGGGAPGSVSIRHFEAPLASVNGSVVSCAGGLAEVTVRVAGGQWPYSVSLMHNGRVWRRDVLVTRADGMLAVPVSEAGLYTLESVRDARRCAGHVSGQAVVKQHPRSRAEFAQSTHTMCAGSSVEVEVVVRGEGGPPPWQVTVLKDEDFFTASAVANTSKDGGSFTFSTRQPGLYKLSPEGFVDGRGCTGTVARSMRVTVAQLPTVTASPASGSVCEGGGVKARLHFTGEPPWSFTIVRAGTEDATTVDDVWTRDYALNVTPGEYVITSLSDRVGTGSCSNSHLSVPIIIRQQPSVSVHSTSCKHLCKDEVGGLIVNLTAGLPPFTLELQDQYGSVIVKRFEASAGEMLLEREDVAVQTGAPAHVPWGAHNWTVRSVVDANECRRNFHVPITSAAIDVLGAAKASPATLDGASTHDVVRVSKQSQHSTSHKTPKGAGASAGEHRAGAGQRQSSKLAQAPLPSMDPPEGYT